MAEDFQAAVCGGSWWNMSPRTNFSRSWCSSVLTPDMDNFWSRDLIMDMKSKSSDNKSSDASMIFHDIQKPSGIMSPDSALQFMTTAFSSSPSATTTDWNQNLLLKVQEELNTFPTSGDHDDSTAVTEADQHQDFTMDQQQSFNCNNFPVSSTSYTAYPSTLLQSFLDNNSPQPPPPPPLPPLQPPQQQPPYNFQSNSNDVNFIPNKQHVPGNLHLTNNTPFWNASGSTLDDNISSYFSSLSSQILPSSYKEKESRPNLIIKPNHQEIRELGSSAKKSSGEFPLKRPRLETPSPLPTFKVRKEKLGDRITALQQLVSPFGKTDTASVLHEAINYIKLLHDQVNILSAPYIKNRATKQLQQIDHDQKVKNAEAQKQDLRSLGLCLVPVSSTFPVANGTATGFWTPSYEGSFK